jgi:hypothetical protein
MAGSAGTTGTRTEPALLGIYLNDHLAGATGGLELVRRSAGAHRGTPAGATLSALAAEIEQDRASLLQMMTAVEVPVRQYKVASAWLVEKLGRLKLNGHLLERSPLSSLIELETLRLGVEGKGCLWRTLKEFAEHEPRLDPASLDELLQRADRQIDRLEELRVQASHEVFGTADG